MIDVTIDLSSVPCTPFWRSYFGTIESELCPPPAPESLPFHRLNFYSVDTTPTERKLYLHAGEVDGTWSQVAAANIPDSDVTDQDENYAHSNDRLVPTLEGCWVQVRGSGGSALSDVSYFDSTLTATTTFVTDADNLIRGHIGEVCVIGLADDTGVILVHPNGDTYTVNNVFSSGFTINGIVVTSSTSDEGIIEYAGAAIRVNIYGEVLHSVAGRPFGEYLIRANISAPPTLFIANTNDGTIRRMREDLSLETIVTTSTASGYTQVESGTPDTFAGSQATDLILYERIPVRLSTGAVESSGIQAILNIRSETGDDRPRAGVLDDNHIWLLALSGSSTLYIVDVRTGDTVFSTVTDGTITRTAGLGVIAWHTGVDGSSHMWDAYDVNTGQVSTLTTTATSSVAAFAPRPEAPQ